MTKSYTPAEIAERMIADAVSAGMESERLTLQNHIRDMAAANASFQETVDNLRKSLGKEREYSTDLRHSQDQYTTDAFRRGRESATTEAAMQFRHMMDMLKEGKKLPAIKSLRKFANIGLKDAKDYIDTISVAYGDPKPEPVTPWEVPPEIQDASEDGPDCGCGDCGCGGYGGGGHV